MKTFFACLLISGLIACNGREKNGLLPEEKFATLLMEFSIAEASYSRLIEADTIAMKTLISRNAGILKKHGVDREDFLETYRHYHKNKKEFLKVYDKSMDMLMKRTEQVRQSNDSLITIY